MSYLIDYLGQILTWLLLFVDWCLAEVFKVLCAAALAVLDAIPVPSFFTSASGLLSALPPGVVYFSQAFDLANAFLIIFSAVGIRFLIRRLPVVG